MGGLLVLGLLIGAGIVWKDRHTIQAWYYVHQLARAAGPDRDAWVARVTNLNGAAVPGLLRCLQQEDVRSCANAHSVLLYFAEHWSPAGRTALARHLAHGFVHFSQFGKQSVVEVEALLLKNAAAQPEAAAIQQMAQTMIAETAHVTDREVRARAMDLAEALLAQNTQSDILQTCRDFASACLRDDEAANRLRAVRLASRPELHLMEQVASLLHDPDAGVRRSAMLVVGPAQDAVCTDELLRSLHDSDSEMRQLCEAVLRSRGLSAEHIRRGRLLTDARPGVRLQVLDGLCSVSDLEPGIWLRHLSHDPEPAVRAAAVRTAAEQTLDSITDRIEQISRDDPSDTVRQMARYYLSYRKSTEPR